MGCFNVKLWVFFKLQKRRNFTNCLPDIFQPYVYFPVPESCLPKCQNGGQCLQDGICACPSGYYGHHCQFGESLSFCKRENVCKFSYIDKPS